MKGRLYGLSFLVYDSMDNRKKCQSGDINPVKTEKADARLQILARTLYEYMRNRLRTRFAGDCRDNKIE